MAAGDGAIVILSGPVGSGKTTVAHAYVEAAPGPIVMIEGDRFWSFIVRPDESQEASRRFTMIMRAMLASARHFERDGYEVLVDFSIPPWYLDGVRALLKGLSFSYVVLRPSEALCAARAAARTSGTIADYTPYRGLYAAFADVGPHLACDDDRPPHIVAEEIRTAVHAGKYELRGV